MLKQVLSPALPGVSASAGSEAAAAISLLVVEPSVGGKLAALRVGQAEWIRGSKACLPVQRVSEAVVVTECTQSSRITWAAT